MFLRALPGMQADELEVREKTAAFVDQVVRPTAEIDDAKSLFRRELFDAVVELGFHALPHDPKYGGKGKPYRCYYAFLEELGRGSLALSVAVGVTNLVQGALAVYGTEAQKDRFLRPLVSGKFLGAFSLSEPQAGSDASALRLSVRREAGGYRVNGNKIWCSSAGSADLYLVMGRTGEHRSKGITSFLVPASTPGFRVGKQEKKLGLRASNLAELIFEDCFIPEEQRLGLEGQGFEVALSQLDAGRISIGAAGIAAATEALEIAWKHLRTSSQDPTIVSYEGSQHSMAESYARLVSLRALMALAASSRDRGESISVLASSIKLLASELAVQVCNDAVHFMGYDGVRTGSVVERLLRDSKALQIVEGTNQVQRLVLTRKLDEVIGSA